MSDAKWHLTKKPYVRDEEDEYNRELLSEAIFPLSEALVWLFLDPSKKTLYGYNILLTMASLHVFLTPVIKTSLPGALTQLFYLFLLTEIKAVNLETEIV